MISLRVAELNNVEIKTTMKDFLETLKTLTLILMKLIIEKYIINLKFSTQIKIQE